MTNLSKAKGLGTGKTGNKDWFYQRVSAVLLFPISMIFLYYVVSILKYGTAADIVRSFYDAFTVSILVSYFLISFWHGKIGLQVVTEDYVHGHRLKLLMIVGLNILWIVLSMLCVFIYVS